MDEDPRGYHDEPGWIAEASHLDPIAVPEPPPPARSIRADARRALLIGIAALLFFGVVLGPIALALGQRARLALVSEARVEGAGMAHAAIALGKVALAIHLAVLATVIPWLLFALPLVYANGP